DGSNDSPLLKNALPITPTLVIRIANRPASSTGPLLAISMLARAGVAIIPIVSIATAKTGGGVNTSNGRASHPGCPDLTLADGLRQSLAPACSRLLVFTPPPVFA